MKRIALVWPGRTFNRRWVHSYTELLTYLITSGFTIIFANGESNNIYQVRNICLRGDPNKGKRQSPFAGKVDYDYMLWIDSDQVFSVDNFKALWEHNDRDIVSAWYVLNFGANDEAEISFGKWGQDRINPKEMPNLITTPDGLLDMDWSGMGFMLVKKGVFETIDYPWFSTEFNEEIEKIVKQKMDVVPDDASFCIKAQQAGFRIYVDPKVRVGHDKNITI